MVSIDCQLPYPGFSLLSFEQESDHKPIMPVPIPDLKPDIDPSEEQKEIWNLQCNSGCKGNGYKYFTM